MRKPTKRFDFMITVENYQYINEVALQRSEEGEYEVSMAKIVNEVIERDRTKLAKMRPATNRTQ